MAIGNDLALAARRLRRAPVSTAVAVLVLALAIGANTAIFSVVDATLLRPLPYPDPDRIVQICRVNQWGDQLWIAPANLAEAMRDRSVFAAAAAYHATSFNLTGSGLPERLEGYQASPGFFAVLGVEPALGTGFSAADGEPGHSPVAVISDRLWRQHFGGDRNVLGRVVDLGGRAVTVVGVMPPGFHFLGEPDAFEPLVMENENQDRGAEVVNGIGRLRPGVSLAAAQARMKALGDRQAATYPKQVAGNSLGLVRLQEQWTGSIRPALLLLLGAAGMVLLIACANLANLRLALVSARHKEIAVRMALGAAPRRIAGEALTEGLVLAVAGGLLGLGLAEWAAHFILAFGPSTWTATPARLDGRVLAFTAALTVASTLLFGSGEALRAGRTNLQSALQEEGRGADSGPRSRRLRDLLAGAEIALVLPLVAATALLGRSYLHIRSLDAGFTPDHMLTAQLSLAQGRSSASIAAFADRLLPRLRALPGVRAAALSYMLPLSQCPDLPATIAGQPTSGNQIPDLDYHPVTPQAFLAMGTPLLRGRALLDSDSAGSAPVAVINARAAALWWPHQNPIGSTIWIGKPLMPPELTDPAPRTIVGVVGDVRQQDLVHAARPAVYLPLAQTPETVTHILEGFFPLGLMVRTEGAPTALETPVEQAIWSVDPLQPVSNVRPMEEIEASAVSPQRFDLVLAGLLAMLALVLAVIGVYGVMSYAVSRRVREIGIRMTLGADRERVMRMILGEGLRVAGAGLAVGLLGWVALARLLQRFLYGVGAWDPTTVAAAAAGLLMIALAACGGPAWRAARMDPVTALREE